LLAAGFLVSALVRDPSSQRAQALAAEGAALHQGDMLDARSLSEPFSEADAVYAITTPFESGTGEEERQGEAIISAAQDTGLEWLLLASVASAGDASVPHFTSKWHVERQLAATDIPWTVIAPSYFYENVLGSTGLIREGVLPMAVPADKPLAQVALANLGQLVAQVLVQRDEHLGMRVEVAGDAPTPAQMASAFGARYEGVPIETISNPDMHAMYEFLSDAGYAVDPAAVRARYPAVPWIDYDVWARTFTL